MTESNVVYTRKKIFGSSVRRQHGKHLAKRTGYVVRMFASCSAGLGVYKQYAGISGIFGLIESQFGKVS